MLRGGNSVKTADPNSLGDIRPRPNQAQWLRFDFPCRAGDWVQRLQAVRQASHGALAGGFARKWHYLVLPTGKNLVLKWSILVRRGSREGLMRHLGSVLGDGSSAPYEPQVKKFGRKSLPACETIWWISSEAASAVLDPRWTDRETRIALAVILQRQLVRALGPGLSLSPTETVKVFRDRFIRIGVGGDPERGADRYRAIAKVARTAFNPEKLRALEHRLRGQLRPMARRFRKEAERLEVVLCRNPLPLTVRSTPDRPVNEILAHRFMHLLSLRLLLSFIDEALVAEIVLLSLRTAREGRPALNRIA